MIAALAEYTSLRTNVWDKLDPKTSDKADSLITTGDE